MKMTITNCFGLPASLLSFVGLIAVQLTYALVYKLTVSSDGGIGFSPGATLTLSEFVKMCMALGLLYNSTIADGKYSNQTSILQVFKNEFDAFVSGTVVSRLFGLAVLYAMNNQLTWYLYFWSDAATFSLFKSLSSFIAAGLLNVLVGRRITGMMWMSVSLQVMGLITIQWDPCKNSPLYPPWVYAALLTASLITAVCSVWNELLLKQMDAPLHLQNTIMYACGAVLNMFAFWFLPPPGRDTTPAFFEGFGLQAALVVFCNSIIGLAITAVYKYGSALLKTFAIAVTTAALMLLNMTLFGQEFSIIRLAGTGVVFIAVIIFFDASQRAKSEEVELMKKIVSQHVHSYDTIELGSESGHNHQEESESESESEQEQQQILEQQQTV
jgi:drug/metabolite transporter (DMT)-like permease